MKKNERNGKKNEKDVHFLKRYCIFFFIPFYNEVCYGKKLENVCGIIGGTYV